MINLLMTSGARSILLILFLTATIASAPLSFSQNERSNALNAIAADGTTDDVKFEKLSGDLTTELLISNHLLNTCQANAAQDKWNYFEFTIGIAAGVVVVLFAGLALRLVD